VAPPNNALKLTRPGSHEASQLSAVFAIFSRDHDDNDG
jgi:hypothetical protein